MCSACFQRRPDRVFVAGAGLAARLDNPPDWLDEFIAALAGSYSPAQACQLITALGRLLDDDGQPVHPQALLERARWPGRSMGPLARSLETFFTGHGLAMPTDHAEQLAAGRRQRRADAVPGPLRPAVDGFAGWMLAARERARRAGTRPRSDHTIETALATMRDLALFLDAERGKQDWALADVHDIEAFLATLPRGRKRRLTVLRQFFRFARSRKIILADPTRDLTAREPRGFTGQTLPLDRQRELFRRWTTGRDAHPHEALLGILALLHGASSHEVRHLRTDDIDETARTARLGRRPRPVPLDPASWQVLQRCLAHREAQRTANPHVMVTKGTKAGRSPASTAYVTHLLDGCGAPPRAVRCTRLADLVNTIDPKLVAAAFGMRPEGVMFYLADHVDDGRLQTLPGPGTGQLPVMTEWFTQSPCGVRFEWGLAGTAALAPSSSCLVIVDVLSFTTTVTVAAEAGTKVFPYAWRDETAAEFARQNQAQLASGRRATSADSPWSLSPAALRHAPFTARLVLPSPNGSAISAAAAAAGPASVIAACLRNARAAGDWLTRRSLGTPDNPATVIAAGERWPDGSLRPALEDLLGAGAVIAAMHDQGCGPLSPEAEAARTCYETTPVPARAVTDSASGRELAEKGFADDVAIATEINSSSVTPVLTGQAFTAAG